MPSVLQRVVFEPYWHPYQFWWKQFFDFKMTYLKLIFASGLQIGLKMAIYDGFSRIPVAILGVSVRPCAWEDEEHDHIKLFTWAFCEKIISRKNFEKKVFVMAQTQGKWLKTMLKIAWKFWKKWIFFDFSKWLLIIIYHRSSAPKCPPDFRELFSSHIDTPINFDEKNFLTSKWHIWRCFSLQGFKLAWKWQIMMGFPRSK